MTDMMRAVEIRGPGGPESLVAGDRMRPTPGPGEILIAVEAAGVNRPDVLQRKGLYPPPPGASDIPGLEAAGRVAEVGPGVRSHRVGDRVCALLSGGGYADYAVAHEGCALPVPRGFDMVQAAALPETFFTVWTNVFERGGLAQGETFLVHGGSSGIGVAAIQLARAFGARVFATAGSPEKCAACLRLGAERAIDHTREDFVAVTREATGGKGVDLILDMVGGDYLARNVKAAALEGRIVNIAWQKGAVVELDFMPVMLKRLTLTGSTLRARTPQQKAEIAASLKEYVWPLLEAGHVRPIIDSTFALEDAAEAHRRMEESRHIGKIVLTL